MAKISQDGLNLIKKFEGLRLNAYLDSVNVPTIGFGTTVYPNGTKVKIGDKITKEQALSYLQKHINDEVMPYIDNLVKVHQEQNKIDALASLIYNIGAGNFKSSNLLKKINSKQPISEIEKSWLAWNKAGGKVLKGLVNRRLSEFKMYKQ